MSFGSGRPSTGPSFAPKYVGTKTTKPAFASSSANPRNCVRDSSLSPSTPCNRTTIGRLNGSASLGRRSIAKNSPSSILNWSPAPDAGTARKIIERRDRLHLKEGHRGEHIVETPIERGIIGQRMV